MTNEQAIDILESRSVCMECVISKYDCDACDEAFKMAIQALSQEPTKEEWAILQKWRDNRGISIKDFEDAMNALQEPCTDAVSRDFQIGDEVRIIGSDPIYDDCDVGWVIRNASERVKTMYVMRNDGSADEEAKAEWYKTGRHNAMLAEVVKALPSVTHKSGKWLRTPLLTCDRCNKINKSGEETDYCPNCGCRMVEPQESEEETTFEQDKQELFDYIKSRHKSRK